MHPGPKADLLWKAGDYYGEREECYSYPQRGTSAHAGDDRKYQR